MKIALIRKNYSLRKAGAERYCVNLSRQLKAMGHQITVIGETIDEDLRDEVEFLRVKVRNTTSWAKNRSFAVNAAATAASRNFDIVHGLSRVPGVDTFRLTDPLQIHWLRVYYPPRSKWLQHLNPRHRTLIELERKLYQGPQTRRIIVQSSLDARLIQEYYQVPPERIRLVRNGVDLSAFREEARASASEVRRELGTGNAPLIVFAGMDFRRKGLDSLLSAMSQLQHSSAQLLVLGDGNLPVYQKAAAKLGISQRVIFGGRKQGMARYYGAADLFVLPTIYEPFPNVNLEAMACGTPVITTATAGGVDLIDEGNNGYLISSAEAISDMTAKIDRHLSLPASELSRMQNCCLQTAARFPIERNAKETLQVFEEVLRERTRSAQPAAA